MQKIAIIMTVFNRMQKTRECLDSVYGGLDGFPEISADLFLTDDGSSDGTRQMLADEFGNRRIRILTGDGSLFWNGGMIKAWKAAISHGGYDGYLWLNNDVIVKPNLWRELADADGYSLTAYGKHGIYVGSLTDMSGTRLTYGGFNFRNKITLSDEFVIPDGSFQTCQCAHGNITYVSSEVVEAMGVFCEKYIHGGTDHAYTYLAHKAGFPLIVLREYVGLCDNDHTGSRAVMADMKLKDRIAFLKSPHGLNLHNTLLFQKRCFPWRYPIVFIMSYFKALCPRFSYNISKLLR